MISKPEHVFDRDWEWGQLERFVADDRGRMTLAVVSGRRRQGKSYLLRALVAATQGFYFEAIEGNAREIIADLGDKLGAHLQTPAPLHLSGAEAALSALGDLGKRSRSPVLIVLDEFPYWCRADPTVASRLRNLLGARTRNAPAVRLVLCGSAVALMGGLLAGQAPLRGRAGLELIVRPFDFRRAREFWGIDDLALAVKVYAVVGGTPAYRCELAADDVPRGPRDFDAWVTRTVLNPAVPLFREARYLLAEDPTIGDLAVYQSVLAAITRGETTSARIAGRLGRPATALGHPLAVLADAGYVVREVDAFRKNRVHYAITEALIAFYHAIVRSAWSSLEHGGHAEAVWHASQHAFSANVMGPTFEAICRTWVRDYASETLFGRMPSRVCRGVVPDGRERQSVEVDVVALGEQREILMLGEAKWGERLGERHLAPLERARELLGGRGFDVSGTRLVLFGGSGFSKTLKSRARRSNMELVDLERLYTS